MNNAKKNLQVNNLQLTMINKIQTLRKLLCRCSYSFGILSKSQETSRDVQQRCMNPLSSRFMTTDAQLGIKTQPLLDQIKFQINPHFNPWKGLFGVSKFGVCFMPSLESQLRSDMKK